MADPLRDYLLANKLVTPEAYEKARTLVRTENASIIGALEKTGAMDEDAILGAFSKYYRVPKAKLGDMDIPSAIIELIPHELATKHRVIPIDRAGNNIIVAMSNPRDLNAIDAIRFAGGFFPKPVLATEARITEALHRYYGRMLNMKAFDGAGDTTGVKQKSVSDERKEIEKSGDDGPIIKLVNQILVQCMKRGASDIHIEPYETFMRVRLRIDGSLVEIARPPIAMKPPLTSRIKIMSSLDISETRLPQDGAINISIGGKPVDFRVNTLPTVYGEKIVMRILDKSALQVDMTALGFEQDELDKFKKSITNPFGMVLVTGPTGSGKTTTLYSALQELNKESENIMTAEDPVEFNLEGINQVGMKPDIGLDFASALRAFLRQDPDVIMVGEIRDLETANIAIKAALTGHMVLSTLHTNSAADTISRLMNMGLEGFNLVAALTCITAQRLMKKICQGCKVVDDSVTPELLVEMGIHPQYAGKITAYKGAGCNTCAGTGTKGRIACHEVLKMNDPVREAILKNQPAMLIKRIAMANGMRSLRQSALNKLAKGQISALEVTKATSADSEGGDSSSEAA